MPLLGLPKGPSVPMPENITPPATPQTPVAGGLLSQISNPAEKNYDPYGNQGPARAAQYDKYWTGVDMSNPAAVQARLTAAMMGNGNAAQNAQTATGLYNTGKATTAQLQNAPGAFYNKGPGVPIPNVAEKDNAFNSKGGMAYGSQNYPLGAIGGTMAQTPATPQTPTKTPTDFSQIKFNPQQQQKLNQVYQMMLSKGASPQQAKQYIQQQVYKAYQTHQQRKTQGNLSVAATTKNPVPPLGITDYMGRTNAQGQIVDANGNVIPRDTSGAPVSQEQLRQGMTSLFGTGAPPRGPQVSPTGGREAYDVRYQGYSLDNPYVTR